MSDEQDKLKLSLEPPKLFGRKKKSDATGADKSAAAASESPAPAESDPGAPAAEEPATEVDEVDRVEEVEEVEERAAGAQPESEPTAEVVTEPKPEPAAAPAKKAAPVKRATPVEKPTPTKRPAAAKATAAATAAAAATAPAKKPARPRAKLAPDIEPEPITAIDDDVIVSADADEPPLLPLYPAAAVTGVLVGATMVVLTWLSLRGCEAIRGTASCGGGPGFLLLIATFVVCILLGGALLKVFQIPDPGSTSFLGVGLVAVVSLLFLIEVLDHWAALIAVPVISVGAFLASVWVTKTFVEPGEP